MNQQNQENKKKTFSEKPPLERQNDSMEKEATKEYFRYLRLQPTNKEESSGEVKTSTCKKTK